MATAAKIDFKKKKHIGKPARCFRAGPFVRKGTAREKIIQILLYFVITLPYNKKWNTLLLCPPGGHPIKWEEIIMANEKILVVDDDTNICELLRLYLTKEGYQVTVANDGEEGLEKFNQVKPDMVLLDVMMPKMDGLEVCRRIRKLGNTPVMMLTAKGETFDKVLGLELGADDYMVKPFDTKEVVARIKAVLRRCQTTTAAAESTEGVIEFDNLRLDMNSYELRVKGKVVEAPPKELELLNCLASHPNRVYTRDQLLDEVWGFEYYGDSRTIDVHVKRLREKLAGASDKWELKTVWGVGYKFEVRQ